MIRNFIWYLKMRLGLGNRYMRINGTSSAWTSGASGASGRPVPAAPAYKGRDAAAPPLQEMCGFLTYLVWQKVIMSLYHLVYDIMF